MAVRTIKVDITGLKDIEKAQKSVSALRDSVLDFEKQLQKLSGKGNSPLSFNVKLEMNTDKALKDYLSLKKQIESLPINNTTKSSVTSDNSGSTNKGIINPNTIPNNNGYVRVRDQDYKSWLNLNSAINNVTSSTIGLASQMVKLGAIAPARGLLSVFTSINRSVLDTQKNLMGLVGNGITGALRGGFSTITSSAKTGFDGLVKEAETLGDAMQVYRINMQALGVDDKEVNKSIKRLGDYGKATVFDASDLLEQAGIYSSYGRTDSEQIVKGYAGLLAQTKNPKEGMKTVTEQTSQMLASGVLNQQDYKFIRQRLSALGASRLNAELQKLAESKGADSIISATKKRLITADEFLDVVNKLGNSDDFQKLVNSIVTPKQAMENLKETLSNLLVYDKIDDEGNSTPGALNRVYVATRDFIKGITEIVGSDRFEGYVKNLGDAIGNTIQSINTFGSAWRLAFGKQFIESISKFAKGFNEGVSGLDVGSTVFKTTKTLFEVLSNSGNSIGQFTKSITTSSFELVDALARIAQAGINGGILNVVSGIVDIYKNIANLAVDSNFVSSYAYVLLTLTNAINNTIKSVNIDTAKSVVQSLSDFITATISLVEGITTKTILIDSLASVLQSALGALTEIINSIGEMGAGRANMALENLKNALIGIIDGIKPLLIELAQGAVIALSSNSGKNFFNAVQGFVQAVVGAIKNTLVSIGGSVEGGLRKLLDFLTLAVKVASGIATLLGGIGKYLLIGFIGTKFIAWASNIIMSLVTVANAMNNVSGGRINPFGLGGLGQGVNSFGGANVAGGVANASKNMTLGRAFSKSVGAGKFTYGQLLSGVENPTTLNKMSASVKSLGTGVKQFGGYVNKLSPAVKSLSMFGAGIALDVGNTAVQNSNASQTVKDGVGFANTTAQGALLGASIGSFIPGVGTGIGALVGAVAGFGMGIYNAKSNEEARKKVETEARKQAEADRAQALDEKLKYLKQVADENASMRNEYYANLDSKDNITTSVAKANSLIEAIKNNSNSSIQEAVNSLGIETAKVPKNVESLFVKIGDQVKSWKELKEETGIQDDQRLLQALQLAKASVGEKTIEFVTESANEVVASISTLTPSEQHRQDSNTDTFKGKLQELGFKIQEGKNIVFNQIAGLTKELNDALASNNYVSADDKATALKNILDKVGIDTSALVGKFADEQLAIIKQLAEQGGLLGGTVEQQKNNLADSLRQSLGETAVYFDNILTNGYLADLQKFNEALIEAGNLKDQGANVDPNKVEAFKQNVINLIQTAHLKLEEGNALLGKAGITDVSVVEVSKGVYEFKNSIKTTLYDGSVKLGEGTVSIKGAGIPDIPTLGIGQKANELAIAVSQSIEATIAKLDEAIKQATQDNNTQQQAVYSNLRRQAEQSIQYSTGGLIPEYHSEGLPVGINWKPRGTDTVPAMLTPGEYVLRKKAVDSLGLGFLNNLNKFGSNVLQTMNKSTIINNIYNTNNAKISQNIDNKSQYLNGMYGVDKLMRYV